MADTDSAASRRARDNRWRFVAATSLLAAFLLGRLSAAENDVRRSPRGPDAVAAGRGPAKGVTDRDCLPAPAPEIPADGWKDILLRVYAGIGEHRILALAAGMTYYGLLAIFPALAALVAVYGLFSDPASIAAHVDLAAGFVPGGAIEVAREQLTRVASKDNQSLGLTFVLGFAASLWSANAAMKSLFDTLNVVYGESEKRSFLKLNAMSMAFTVVAIGFALLALGAVVAIPVVLNYLWLSNAADLLVRVARWPALFVGLVLSLACIYRFGPCRERRAGDGSRGEAWPLRCSGLPPRRCSRGTRPISARSTRPTARWARRSAS